MTTNAKAIKPAKIKLKWTMWGACAYHKNRRIAEADSFSQLGYKVFNYCEHRKIELVEFQGDSENQTQKAFNELAEIK